MPFSEDYSKLSNDEILNLASDPDGLLQSARAALSIELERRGLSGTDISTYKKHLAEIRQREWQGKEKFAARSFNGFGIAIYGKQDFWLNSTFITTKWVVFFWIPILPVRSMRLRTMGRARSAFPMGSSTPYQIYPKEKLHLRQVLCVYAVVALALLLLILCLKGFFPDEVLLSFYLGLFVVVWLLRRASRTRSTISGAKGEL